MAILNPNWYAHNSTISYPIHDGATTDSDTGQSLPTDIITDLSVHFPRSLAQFAFLGSIRVSPRIVTLTILGSTSASVDENIVLLASVSLPKPITLDRMYPLQSQQEGVSGWVVFGSGSNKLWEGKFSRPSQSLLSPRTAQSYRTDNIQEIGKAQVVPALSGLVRLEAGNDIFIELRDTFIRGRERRAIHIGLEKRLGEGNVFDIYRSPCSGRPESQTCAQTSLETINTVQPDCDGIVRINFEGEIQVQRLDNGIALDYPLSISQACLNKGKLPNALGVLPRETDDLCTSSSDEGFDPDIPNSSEEITPSEPILVSCVNLPHFENFSDYQADSFQTMEGIFQVYTGDVSSEYSADELNSDEGNRFYRSLPGFDRSVAIWNPCSGRSSYNKRVYTRVALPEDYPGHQAAGLVVNWHLTGSNFREEYFLVSVDYARNSFQIQFFNGFQFVLLSSQEQVPIVVGDRYDLRVDVTGSAGVATLSCRCQGVDDPSIDVTLTLVTNRFGDDDGEFGVGTMRSTGDFLFFGLEDL